MRWRDGVIAAAIIAVAMLFRFIDLEDRPLHTDEAIHAAKLGELIETGIYNYDPNEYHGPTLNYFSLIPAYIGGADNFAELNEHIIRIVPAIFGLLIVVLLLYSRTVFGWRIAFSSALFTALSPAMVYYSRYYIMEILFLFFTLALLLSAYRYAETKKTNWAIVTGISFGFLFSTKETWLIIDFCIAISIFASFYLVHKNEMWRKLEALIMPPHILYGLISAVVIIFLLYGSMLKNPMGFFDSFSFISIYMNRATENADHIQPWYYYFRLLNGTNEAGAPLWSESFILIFAAIGVYGIFTKSKSSLPKLFLVIFTLLLAVIFSLIPYKTPWNLIIFHQGFIILAAFGVLYLWDKWNTIYHKMIILALCFTATLNLGWQSYQINFNYSSDPSNPYVYAHTSADMLRLTGEVERIIKHHPNAENISVQVISTSHDYWPLPWYFRYHQNVAYDDNFDSVDSLAHIVIISADMESSMAKVLFEKTPPGKRNLYVPLLSEYNELRPGIELRGFVRQTVIEQLAQEPDLEKL